MLYGINILKRKCLITSRFFFSIPKRAYKNLRILSDMGFVELISISETKYLRFTSKCTNWKCQYGNYFVI